ENFRDCEIPVEELFDGTYFHWLETLSKPFDQSKIKDVPFSMLANMIVYNLKTAPNFEDQSTAPFRRDVTVGIAFLEIDGVRTPYIVKPIEFFDKNEPNKNKWVITVDPFDSVKTRHGDNVIYEWGIRMWQEEMNTTPIWTDAFPYVTSNDISLRKLEDPLVKQTFDNNPDMEARLKRFFAGEVSALSQPGIVLLTGSSGSDIFR
ncbi:MAG: hypothetical protein Q8P11_04395, partial [bacterium]|nr:hypothetical protein [bacterium]